MMDICIVEYCTEKLLCDKTVCFLNFWTRLKFCSKHCVLALLFGHVNMKDIKVSCK